MCHQEDVSSKENMKANDWTFEVDVSHKGFEDTCTSSQNPKIKNTWYGWQHFNGTGTVSKSLKGSGSGKLIYGNCLVRAGRADNVVRVYLDGVLLSQAGSGEVKEVNFGYQDNDVLKLEEPWAIIKIHRLELNCGKKDELHNVFLKIMLF